MADFCANLSTLFRELPLPDRFEAAARAGFEAVELSTFEGCSPADLRDALRRHRLRLAMIELPLDDEAVGLASMPDRCTEFRRRCDEAAKIAAALGSPMVNCAAAAPAPGIPSDAARAAFVENMRYMAARLMTAGIQLLIEPRNPHDLHCSLAAFTREAVAIIDEIGARNVSVLCDAYEMHRAGEAVTATLGRYLTRIGHIRIADAPGRHEPGTGELGCDGLFAFLDGIGYCGWIGCAYLPLASTAEGLSWFAPHRRQPPPSPPWRPSLTVPRHGASAPAP